MLSLAPVALIWMIAATGNPVSAGGVALPVNVACMDTGSVDGHAGYGTYDGSTFTGPITIEINVPICATVNLFAQTRALRVSVTPQRDTAWSLLVIAHEPQHVAHPFYSEAVANCAALLRVPILASALGASRAIAHRAFLRARAWTNRQHPLYRSRCTAGTTLKIKTPPGLTPRPF